MKIIYKKDYPEGLKNMGNAPDFLFIEGNLPPKHYIYLCVIGSRHNSEYGEEVCRKLLGGLRGYPIVIVSGLAIGIDSIAHEVAIQNELPTVSFPGSGLSMDIMYPPSKRDLAKRIVSSGGALLSMWSPDFKSTEWSFVVRNELMAGISKAVLIIEARERSGTLTTVDSALRLNKDVLIVPGSIFSELSVTPLKLMHDGAKPITNSQELLQELGFIIDEPDLKHTSPVQQAFFYSGSKYSEDEIKIIERLRIPTKRDDLIRELALPAGYINSVLMDLELKGMIREISGFLTIKIQ